MHQTYLTDSSSTRGRAPMHLIAFPLFPLRFFLVSKSRNRFNLSLHKSAPSALVGEGDQDR